MPIEAQACSVGFTDESPWIGVTDYQRVRSSDFAISQAVREQSLVEPWDPNSMPGITGTPMASHGIPGVSIFDYDSDGDLDVFVSNGPGAPHSLFQNQLAEWGSATFVDKAMYAGVAAVEMDGNGSCHGDIDNDGDPDLLVLGRDEANRLYENQGDGTFVQVADSGLGLDLRSHVSCSMGDVDGDGLLDVAIANTFDMSTLVPIFAVPYELNHHNQLYLNNGDNSFTDVSADSGIEQLGEHPPGASSISWAITMVDVDLDGDLDIVHTDDNGPILTTKFDPINGIDRGFVQILSNDGSGHFTAEAVFERPEAPGSWMGLGFGDFNCDGSMDLFASNFGDYHMPTMGMPYELGDQSSRVMYGNGDGSFNDPDVDGPSAFGWGIGVLDVDNDGDTDIIYHGGLELTPIALRDNPGILLENQGCSGFVPNYEALGERHLRRNVHGVATGDLDRDGFVDVVSVANWVAPEPIPLLPSPASYGSELDTYASFIPTFVPNPDDPTSGMVWSGIDYAHGDLMVEMNSGNTNGSVTIHLLGTVGLTDGGVVNRDGIGAVVSFTPQGSDHTVMTPITGGSSHASSHATEAYFGLGTAPKGTVEILWPGGVRNRVYNVKDGAELMVPEVPCSYDTDDSFKTYKKCVKASLKQLKKAGIISKSSKNKLLASALKAYQDTH